MIVSARSDNFCDSSKFKTELSDCLKCANEFDIWKYYGDSVSKAAKSCGLDATPEDADSEDNSTATQNAVTTSAESSAFESKTSARVATTSAQAEETSSAQSATQSFTTTALAAGSSHPVIPTGSATVSGTSTPASHTAVSQFQPLMHIIFYADFLFSPLALLLRTLRFSTRHPASIVMYGLVSLQDLLSLQL